MNKVNKFYESFNTAIFPYSAKELNTDITLFPQKIKIKNN